MEAALSTGVALAVLGSALLHAGWNALVKGGPDPAADMALVGAGSSVIAVPFVLAVPLPESASWPYLAATVAIHFGYFVALAAAYEHGDLSLGYPVMRGAAPVMVAGAAWPLFGEVPTPQLAAGVVLVSAGILWIGFAAKGSGRPQGAALGWALANAVIIAAYTIVDAAGVRSAGGAMRYVAWSFLLMPLPFFCYVLALQRNKFVAHVRTYWRRGLGGGACLFAAYGIALWAMTRAPVAAVAALRETSVVFATLFGALVLKEGLGWKRLGGALAVAAGVAAMKL